MARRFVTPRINRLFRDATESLITEFSKRSTVYAVTHNETPCPNCIQDARDGSSTGIYKEGGAEPFENATCPVCDGIGKIKVEKKLRIPCNVRWGPTESANPMAPQGELKRGQVKIKTFYRYWKLVESMQEDDYFLIDNIVCKPIGESTPRGLLDYVSITKVLQQSS